MNKTMTVIGWLVSIVVTIIGTYGATTAYHNQTNVNTANSNNNYQTQEQKIIIQVDGENIELNQDNAQKIYGDLEDEKSDLNEEIENLKESNESLNSELSNYKQYGTAALVSKNKSYDSDKVSLFAFEPVNKTYWESNDGTLKDSLGNNYTVNLDYIILGGYSCGEYYTNQNYSALQFTLAPHESMSQDSAAVVKVFADDLLVFTSDEITRKSEAESYTADISNSKFIKIICENIGYSGAEVLCLDLTLIK